MLQTLSLSEIYRPVEKDLERFQNALKEAIYSEDPFLRELGEYFLKISGKHLRPAVTLLCSKLGKSQDDLAIRLAISIELLHTATLVHDDIVDGALHRRSHPSLNAKWGSDVSLIWGDFIYAKAFQTLSSIGNSKINQMFSACAQGVCEGEMKQVETRNAKLVNEDDYLAMIHKKTAVLFKTACLAGGFASGCKKEELERLAEYGKNLGMTFQIVDDCLDFIGEEEVLGKAQGADLAAHDPTLPLIYLLESDSEKEKALDKLLQDSASPEQFKAIKDRVISSGSISRSLERAQSYANAAVRSLEGIQESIYRKSLLDLVDYTIQRAS